MKTLLNLYIDGEIKSLAKAKGINLSRCFEQFLSIELELLKSKDKITDKELISQLKQKIALISAELEKNSKELEILKKKQKDNKPRWKEVPYDKS